MLLLLPCYVSELSEKPVRGENDTPPWICGSCAAGKLKITFFSDFILSPSVLGSLFQLRCCWKVVHRIFPFREESFHIQWHFIIKVRDVNVSSSQTKIDRDNLCKWRWPEYDSNPGLRVNWISWVYSTWSISDSGVFVDSWHRLDRLDLCCLKHAETCTMFSLGLAYFHKQLSCWEYIETCFDEIFVVFKPLFPISSG